MKKSLLYIVIHFTSAVVADWITVEHDFNMCDQDIPSDNAAFHIDDNGISYTSSFLIREIQTIKHGPPLTTLNITMWGCTFDCNFSFMVKINRVDLSVSSYTENNNNNYKCDISNYTMKLIPTPKITYNRNIPNPNHVYPSDLTAMHCSEGKHPDSPGWPINQTEHVAECIDYLTGHEVGTYAASLQYGSGSSFSPDGYGVATYHMINSANKLFNYWERHHRGFHEAINELSIKMTPDNLKELIPPPPPPPKRNLLKEVILPIALLIIVFALPFAGNIYAAGAALIGRVMAAISETAAEVGAVEDAVELALIPRETALTLRIRYVQAAADRYYARGEPFEINWDGIARDFRTTRENIDQIRARLFGDRAKQPEAIKRDTTTANNLGFFTANIVNEFFLPTVMDNVHQSFTGSGQNHPDISSYLSAASENLLFHFDYALHNNFFTANKSVLASFTVNQGMNDDKLLANDDDVYHTIKQSTYNTMAATIISITLKTYNVEICDPKPSFCGQSCDSGHIYCPIVGNDTNSCVIAASDGQIKELNFLRDTSDICSTNTTSTGWDINHNPNCDIKQFQCK